MKVSYLLDILVGGVCDIDELPVGEVGKKVPIGLPPVLGCLGCLLVAWGQCGMMVLCCGVWLGPMGTVKMTVLQSQ